VDQINLRAARHPAEIQHEDGPVLLLPVSCPPKLHNLLAGNQKQVLTLKLAAKSLEFSAHLAADSGLGAGGTAVLFGIEIQIKKSFWGRSKANALLDNGRQFFSRDQNQNSDTLEKVSHLTLLGPQIGARDFGDAWLARNSLDHAHAPGFKLFDLVGIIGKQANPLGAKLP